MGGVAGVEIEGTDIAVVTSDVPRRRDGEGDTEVRIVEGARRRRRRFGRGGLALQKRRYGFGFAGNGLLRRLPVRRQNRQQCEREIGEENREFHVFISIDGNRTIGTPGVSEIQELTTAIGRACAGWLQCRRY